MSVFHVNDHGESPPRIMKLRASTDPIPLPASPLKGEETNSLPLKGEETNSLPFKGRVGEGMGNVVHVKAEAEIVNKLGLHARASARLTRLAGQFPCEVWMERKGKRINAKSIMGVMMLAAGQGSTVVIETIGDRADEALEGLLALIANRFGEEE